MNNHMLKLKIKFEGVEAIITWGGLKVNAISSRYKLILFLLFCFISADCGGGTTTFSGIEGVGITCAFCLR